jgi:hypothetical protein
MRQRTIIIASAAAIGVVASSIYGLASLSSRQVEEKHSLARGLCVRQIDEYAKGKVRSDVIDRLDACKDRNLITHGEVVSTVKKH